MGCGISKFDPKEVVEATSTTDSPPHTYTKSNCFTGESKPNLVVHERGVPVNYRSNGSPDEPPPHKGHPEENVGKVKMMMNNVKRGDHREPEERDRRTTEFQDLNVVINDENELSGREICRGGSPSFREYCIDSDSISRSMRSEGKLFPTIFFYFFFNYHILT